MINNTKKSGLLLLMLILFASCSQRNLVYFSDLPVKSQYSAGISNIAEPKIQSGDILSIKVNSLNAESNAIFNGISGVNNSENTQEGYVVDNEGFINFPIVGKIKIAGLTSEEARERVTKEVVKYVKDPIINLRIVNFKVTVVGEVTHPSSFTVPNGKINLLEALGMAGDMTVYGKRENVLVIREKQGTRTMARVNLNTKDVLNSPYFNLQQNDVVYVEPVKARASQAAPGNRYISLIVGLTSVVTLIISRVIR